MAVAVGCRSGCLFEGLYRVDRRRDRDRNPNLAFERPKRLLHTARKSKRLTSSGKHGAPSARFRVTQC